MIAFFEKKRYDIFLCIILAMILCLSVSFFAYCQKVDLSEERFGADFNRLKEKISGIEKSIARKEKQLKGIESKEGEALQKMAICDQVIDKYKYKRKLYDDKIGRMALEQERLSCEVRQLQKSIANQKNFLALRLRAWYKIGQIKFWQVILGSGTTIELSRRITYFKSIMAKDQNLIKDFSSKLKKMQIKEKELHCCQKEIADLREELIEQEKEWEQTKQEKKQYLNLLKVEEKKYRLSTRSLYIELSEIQKLLANLPKKSHQGQPLAGLSGFVSRKGKLPWPIHVKCEGESGACVKKSNQKGEGAHNQDKGLIIQAPQGTEIYAIHTGRILYADWCPGYGKLLIVDHGDGYYCIYGHLSEWLVGRDDAVKEGQSLARVGDTGAVERSQLYFEIRHQAVALDPRQWLQ